MIGEYWKYIKKILSDADHKSSVFIRHFRNIILSKLKLIDFAFFYISFLEMLSPVVSPSKIRF